MPPAVNGDFCADADLSASDAEALCAWGIAVLGGEGTTYQAPCIVTDQDAGAGTPVGRTPLAVLSNERCVQALRA